MKILIPDANLLDYNNGRKQINYCKSNLSKNQNINSVYPILNSLLGLQHISAEDARSDTTSIDLGNNPYHFIKTSYQSINVNELLSDITDVISISLQDGIDYLNRLTIRLPFSRNAAEQILTNKFFTQSVPSKSIYSEDLQRYVDKIQVIAIHEDLLKLQKEFPLDKMVDILYQIYSTMDYTDMSAQITDITDYDLSTFICSIEGNKIVYDLTTNFINSAVFKNINNQILDFTNLFIDNSFSIEYDQTFRNHIIDGSNITAQMDSSNFIVDFTVGSPFDSSYVLLSDNIMGSIVGAIKAYNVPVWTKFILPNEIPTFFRTESENFNEFINSSISISYGTYVYNLLRFYYGFDDEVNTQIIRLILGQCMKNAEEDLVFAEVSQLIENITGLPKTSELLWTSSIKTIETQLSAVLQDITGNDLPVIYHNDFIDVTTSIRMNYNQSLDDIYSLLTQLNKLSFLYIVDFGCQDNMNLLPFSVIVSKDKLFVDSGYLSFFVADNMISI